jgi:hypothetical protein
VCAVSAGGYRFASCRLPQAKESAETQLRNQVNFARVRSDRDSLVRCGSNAGVGN